MINLWLHRNSLIDLFVWFVDLIDWLSGLLESMIDLSHFVLWLIASLFFIKLVELDCAYVCILGLIEDLCKRCQEKGRRGRLLMCNSNIIVILIISLRYLSWPCDLGKGLCATRCWHRQGFPYHEQAAYILTEITNHSNIYLLFDLLGCQKIFHKIKQHKWIWFVL